MNFFDGILSEIKGEKGKFSGKLFEKVGIRIVYLEKNRGENVRLGIRPQHLKLAKRGPINGMVSMIERLGTETVVELSSPDNTPFRFVSSENLDLFVGENCSFDFKPEFAHLF